MKAIDKLTAAQEHIEKAIELIDESLSNTTLEMEFGQSINKVLTKLKSTIKEADETFFTIPEIIELNVWDQTY